MKWKVVIGLSAILMGIFASYLWSQEKDVTAQQGKANAAASPQKGTEGWAQLRPGVRVLKLWQTATGPKRWPEIAILDLSNAEYTDFKKDVSAFLNTHHIFSKNVQSGAAVTELEPPPTGYNGSWTVGCGHTMTSTASPCISAIHVEEKSGTSK